MTITGRGVSIGDIIRAVFSVNPRDVDPIGARMADLVAGLTKVAAEQNATNRELLAVNAELRRSNEELRQSLLEKAATEIQEWVSTERAAAILGYTEATIRRMCRDGVLDGIKPNGDQVQAKWRVRTASVERYRAATTPRRRRVTPKAPAPVESKQS